MITYRRLGKLGRWGNQLFEVAGVTLYARRFGYHAAFPHWTGCDIFESMRPYTPNEYLHSRFLPTRQLNDTRSFRRWQIIRKTYALASLYEHPQDNINFYGYMQDPLSLKLLQENKDTILNLYSFKPEIDETYQALAKPRAPYIALHLRRGDFVKRGFALPSSFYHEVLKKINAGRKIYVSSDDPHIIKELADLKLETFKLLNPLPSIPDFIFDFWMIKNAQTVVGCGSTFSWWAAYLGNRNDYYSPPLTHLWQKEVRPPALEKVEI